MRPPRVLALLTWGYLAWSLVPVVVAVTASLGSGPLGDGRATFDAYRAVLGDGETRAAFEHSLVLALVAVLVAVPLGTALGIALGHLERRAWRAVRGVLFAAVALPHAALAVVAMYLVLFASPFHLDTGAQIVGHVTLTLPFVALIVWTRMLFLDPGYEEQAADLGAPPSGALVRVLVPMCRPAIVVAAAVAFAISFNELPVSQYLCTPSECRTVPMLLGGQVLGDVPPPAFAIGVIATLVSLATLVLILPVFRVARRRST